MSPRRWAPANVSDPRSGAGAWHDGGRQTAGDQASSYACSVRTSRPAVGVLDELADLDVADVEVVERSATYLVLAPPRSRRFTATQAVALTVVAAIAVLALAAWQVVLVALLPLAAAPLALLLLDDQPMLGIGVVSDDSGAVRVTAHGRARTELARAVDAYLVTLPPAEVMRAGGRAVVHGPRSAVR